MGFYALLDRLLKAAAISVWAGLRRSTCGGCLTTTSTAILLSTGIGNAQPGSVDTSLQFGPASASFSTFYGVGALPDGKILVSGDFTSIEGYFRDRFARLNSNGSLDLDFAASPGFAPSRILVQQDGRFFLQSGRSLYRYSPDGSRDTNFNISPPISASSAIQDVLLRPDGRLLVVGWVGRGDETEAEFRGLRWLRNDGSWDTNFSSSVSSAQSAFVQTNGQILVGGSFSVPWPDGGTRSRIVRLNPDGTVDTSFDPGSGPDNYVSFVWGQPDGKVVISGSFSRVRDYARDKIARFNPDGTLDSVFPQPGWQISACMAQPDGKLFVRGGNAVLRLSSDWSPDPTFRALSLLRGGSPDSPSWGLQADGKLLLVGGFDLVRAESSWQYAANRIVRINGDNPIPLRFDTQPIAQTLVEGARATFTASVSGYPSPALQWQFGDADIAAATNASLVISNVVEAHSGAYRLVASNAIETIVSDTAMLTVLVPPTIVDQPQAQQVPVGGTFSVTVRASGSAPLSYQWKHGGALLSGETNASLTITNVQAGHTGGYTVTVTNAAGSALSETVVLTVLLPPSISIQPRSQAVFTGSPFVLVVVASGDGPISYQWWFNDTELRDATNATLDATAPMTTGTNSYRVVVGNPYGTVISATALLCVLDSRTQSPGSLDLTFEPPIDLLLSASCVSLASDGRVVIAGDWRVGPRVGRFFPDGTLDDSFTGSFPTRLAVVQPDQRVLVGHAGSYYTLAGVDRYGIARLRTDGVLDQSFAPTFGLRPSSSVSAIAVQSDGRIVVGGAFTNVNRVTQRGLTRLNADASTDTNFAVGDGVDYRVHAIALQPDGGILVGGEFSRIAGAMRNGIGRLNPDGSPDWGFDPGWGVDDAVRAIAVQPDGKVVIAGSFTLLDLEPRNRIARLNPNGTLDRTFDPLDGPDGAVYTLAYQPDGKLLLGGTFTNYNGVPCLRVARLMPDGMLDTSFDTSDGPNGDVLSLALQPDGRVVIGGSFSAVNGIARPGLARLNGNVEPPAPPTVVSQPQHQEVFHGADVNFTVQATGTLPVVYQWFRDAIAVTGATNSTLTLTNVQPADAGAYTVLLTNVAGSATGGPAALTVDGTPALLRQPFDQSVGAGASVMFSVEAFGPGPISYQWLHDGQSLADGPTVEGSSTAKLRLERVEFASQGNYSARVSNPFGSILSRTAKLLLIPTNDQFAAATPLGSLGGQAFADNRNASKEAGEPDHAGNHGGRSVWFTWTAGTSGAVIVDTLGSTFDTLLGVYQGTNVAGLTLIAANDDGVGFEGNSRAVFPAVAGNTYMIAVDGYDGACGAIRLNLSYEQPVLDVRLLAPTGPLQVNLSAQAGAVVVVETSSDLRTWIPTTTNVVPSGGALRFSEDLGAGEQQRFYRVIVR